MGEVELTILMPCLNEEKTIEICIKKAKEFLKKNNINGEVLIADNGSTDQSPIIAEKNGARVVFVKEKGYGSALINGSKEAKDNKIYLIVKREDDGRIKTVRQITMEEVMERIAHLN